MTRTVVAFDFDGTLTRRDSLLPFLRYAFGMPRFIISLIIMTPTIVLYLIGRLRNNVAKERVISRFLAGKSLSAIEPIAQKFAQSTLPKLLRKNMLIRLHEHQRAGHICALVSASLALYLRPWAQDNGFQHVLCTELETDRLGNLTGKFSGNNCYGPEKARRLTELLEELSADQLIAYGDSAGDYEMLTLADVTYFKGHSSKQAPPLDVSNTE